MCLAIPGQLLEKQLSPEGVLTGKVQFGGVARQVCLDFLPESEPGDYLLVHVGFAISKIDEKEARESLDYLEKTGMLAAELDDSAPAGPSAPATASGASE